MVIPLIRNYRAIAFITCFGVIPISMVWGEPAIAQIIPDSTLGNENSIVTPNILVQGSVGDRIDGGAIRGPNLFHSFEQFDINDSQRVYFANPTGIETILSRVTGNDISDILGTLGVDGTADLFFLNPNGIVFGPNVRLDIRGSFVGTTATQFTFPDGNIFSAANPQAAPLLTVNVPIGLQYGMVSPGEESRIINHGILATGAELTLASHSLHLQGQLWSDSDLYLEAQDTLHIREGENTPFIAAARGNMWLRGGRNLDILTLGHPDSGFYSLGNMTLQSSNPISGDAHYWSGGQFRVEQLDGESGHWLSRYDPIIRSQGDVTFANYEGTSLHILSGGAVTVGTVIITGTDATGDTINPVNTPDLATVTLSSGESIVIDGSARPTVDIRAGMRADAIAPPLGTSGVAFPSEAFFNISDDNVILDPSPQNTSVATSANITLDEIIIDFPNGLVLLTNQYTPNVSLPGGNITITGDGLTGFRGIDARSPDDFGGTIIMDAQERVQFNPDVNVIAAGQLGGDIQIYADVLEMQSNSFLATGVLPGTNAIEGRSGDIQVAVRDRLTLNQADISNFVLDGIGETAGDIWLTAAGTFSIDGGNIRVGVLEGIGQGGDINIVAQDLHLLNESQISNGLFTAVDSTLGDISIQVGDEVRLENNASILMAILLGSSGTAGNITLTGRSLSLLGGSLLGVWTYGVGDVGDVTITIDEGITVGQVGDLAPSSITTQVAENAVGNSGDVTVLAQSLSMAQGSQIKTDAFGKGNSGHLQLDVGETQLVDFSGISSQVGLEGQGNSGSIDLTTTDLNLAEGGFVSGTLFGAGNTEDITIMAQDVTLNGLFSNISSLAGFGGQGRLGKIHIDARSLSLQDGARLVSSVLEQGNSSNIHLTIEDTLHLSGTAALSEFQDLPSDALFEGIPIAALLAGLGDSDADILIGSSIGTSIVEDGVGNSGNLTVQVGNLRMEDFSGFVTSSAGLGNAGDISIDARDDIRLDQSFIVSNVASGGQGRGGDIEIGGRSLTLLNGSQISSSLNRGRSNRPAAQGEGGRINVNATELVEISGIQVDADTSVLNVITLNLQDTEATGLSSGLFTVADLGSQGSPGDITVTSPVVKISDAGVISASTQSTLSEVGGDIIINANQFMATDGGQVNSFTLGPNNAGTIRLNVADTVMLSGSDPRLESSEPSFAERSAESGLYANTRSGSGGNGGSILINGPKLLSIEDEGQISVFTLGEGGAGNILIRDVGQVQLSNGSISSAVLESMADNTGASLEGDRAEGGITIDTGTMTLTNSSNISASTAGARTAGTVSITANSLVADQASRIESVTTGQGNAGNINLDVIDEILLSGAKTGILASTSADSSGRGGSIIIDPELVVVEDGAVIAVDSEGTGTGGNVRLTANVLRLDDGRLLAATDSTNGGDISLNIGNLLFLRNNSQISAEAGRNQGGGDGGNIDITAPFVVAILGENSDIVANAVAGDGGRIDISTFRIFGMAERLGTREELQNNQTNDMSASSQFGTDGVVAVEDLGVDPVQAAAELPTETDTSPLSQGCQPGADGRGRFVNIERGGIAPAPTDVLDSDWGWEDVAPIQEEGNLDSESMDPQGAIATDTAPPNPEATTWLINRQGKVVLHAAESTLTSLNCQL